MRFAVCLPMVVACHVALIPSLAGAAGAASPKVEQALQLVPMQKGVDFDRPTDAEAAKCTISAQRVPGRAGWIVADPSGMLLRQFVDTNGDNVVDQWSYYKDGLEVYRDIDGNFNGKADQYRWFHTAGGRWGTDGNEDGRIDAWRTISAEEVTAEVVAALATRDAGRFARVALTEAELKSLGLGPERAKELSEKVKGLAAKFNELAGRQKVVTGTTTWAQFSGSRPGLVPAGTDGSTKDLQVYENVVAVVQTGDEHAQVQIGTLIQVGNVWRVIDLPVPVSNSREQLASSGFFFRSPLENQAPTAPAAGPDEKTQELLTQLEQLDAAASQATSLEAQARYNARRADLLEEMAAQADSAENRAMWLRQLADTVSAAVQSGGYPDGVQRLSSLSETLRKSKADQELAGYVRFRQLTAEYGLAIQAPNVDFVKVQGEWLKSLEQYVSEYPKNPDAAEAMLQLAIAHEFAGQEEQCKQWYGRIVAEFPSSAAAKKAAGAQRRLESVGKSISLKGKSPSGEVIDLAAYRGKVVLIQYWASWCEPCKTDMPTLKDALAKYGRSGFSIIGVNLDSSLQDMANYLSEDRLPWPQIHEKGGLDSRPANELGILTLPTMILVDQQGKVVHRNIHVVELDRELKKLIR